jgi:hypothetical protein
MLNHERFWVYLWLFSLAGWTMIGLSPLVLLDFTPRMWVALICLVEGSATALSLYLNWNKRPLIK